MIGKKNKIEIAITLVLVIIFFVALSNSIKKIKNAKRRIQRTTEINSDVSKVETASSIYDILSRKSSKIKIVRDPFSRVPFKETNVSSPKQDIFSLSGIIWDDVSPKAIVNGKIVREGDSIGGKKVIKIEKDAVVLKDKNKTYRLTLTR